MRGTTWVQIIKAALLIVGAARHDRLGARQVRVQPLRPARRRGRPVEQHAASSCSTPAPQYGKTGTTQARLRLAGARAGPRHRGPAARADAVLHGADRQGGPPLGAAGRSGSSASSTCSPWSSATARPRWSAADAITAAPGKANSAAPLLAFELGGTLLLGIIAAVAFATILAVVAGLTITASASFAHDIYANVIKHGEADDPAQEVRVARVTALVDRRRRDRRRHPRQRPERRVPGGAGLRGRRVGEPADAPVLAVLEEVQHHRARCAASTAAWSICLVLIVFSPVVSGQRRRRSSRDASTSHCSRWRTRASCRSRCRSCSA